LATKFGFAVKNQYILQLHHFKILLSNYYFQLHPNNKTEVGRLAQELFQTKDATLITVPSIEETVFYLLEIGFLKVQRDLQFIALSELNH
jgi:hypothetical protein